MEVPTFDAENQFSALLDEVTRGVDVMIARSGVPMAKIVSVGPTFDREKAMWAAEGLRRARARATLGGLLIKDLVDEGRS